MHMPLQAEQCSIGTVMMAWAWNNGMTDNTGCVCGKG